MKVRIEINENMMDEEEVIIRCSKLDESVQRVYDTLMDISKSSK